MKVKTLSVVLVLILSITVAPKRSIGQSTSGATITNFNLKSMLENMGFETKDLGADSYQITINQGTIVPMSVTLSTDESRI